MLKTFDSVQWLALAFILFSIPASSAAGNQKAMTRPSASANAGTEQSTESDALGTSQSSPGLVLSVGNDQISEQEFLLHLQQTKPQIRFWELPDGEQQRLIEEFAAQRALALQALEIGLDQDPEVRARLNFFRDRVLAQALRDRNREAIVVSHDEITSYFHSHLQEFKTPDRLLLEHLVYSSPAIARGARKRLQDGTPFQELASARTEDPRLVFVERKWLTPELLLPELQDVATNLTTGGISELVRTSYGWHLLRLADKDPGRQLTLEEASPEIDRRLRQSRSTRVLDDLTADALSRFPLQISEPTPR